MKLAHQEGVQDLTLTFLGTPKTSFFSSHKLSFCL